MAKLTDKEREERYREQRFFFLSLLVSRLLRWIVVAVAICYCFTVAFSELGDIATTIAEMALDRWLLLVLVFAIGGGTIPGVKIMLKAIGREHRRLKELEEERDKERSSSGLTEEGEAREGDT